MSIENNTQIDKVLLDFSKVLDKVPHQRLSPNFTITCLSGSRDFTWVGVHKNKLAVIWLKYC
jgi:hypothetical protein